MTPSDLHAALASVESAPVVDRAFVLGLVLCADVATLDYREGAVHQTVSQLARSQSSGKDHQ